MVDQKLLKYISHVKTHNTPLQGTITMLNISNILLKNQNHLLVMRRFERARCRCDLVRRLDGEDQRRDAEDDASASAVDDEQSSSGHVNLLAIESRPSIGRCSRALVMPVLSVSFLSS